MRTIQYQILKKILEQVDVPEYIYAFEKNKSIPVMAQLHTRKYVVLSIDIKDFFHSIKQKDLLEMFLSLGIGPKAAVTLSELCTYKSFVPQGALTSPKIANIITASTFGPEVKKYCDDNNLTLSIYADDITVSSDDKALNTTQVLSDIYNIVRREKFRVNIEKTKVMFTGNRQYVCGVVVNQKVNLIAKERYRLRAMVHNTIKNGPKSEADKNDQTESQFLSHLKGKLNWFRQLNPELGNKYFSKLQLYLKANDLEKLIDESASLEIQKVETPAPVAPVVTTLQLSPALQAV